MGPERSLAATYNLGQDRKGRKRVSKAPGRWTEICHKWKWRERAEAWDESERQRMRKLQAKEAEAFAERHTQALNDAHAKLQERLGEIDFDALDANRLIGQVIAVGKELCALYGLAPVQKMEVSGAANQPMTVDLELRKVISKRAEQFRDQMDSINRR